MNRVLCFSSILWILLLSCSLKNTKDDDNDFDALWRPIIQRLNENPKNQSSLLLSPATDLLEQNRLELAEINAEWLLSHRRDLDKNELRKKENKFFFDHVYALNEKLTLTLEERAKSEPEHKNYRALAEKILLSIESNPVSSSAGTYAFEMGEQIGFCFGRALLAHYLLLKSGVPEDDILKIFSIGELKVHRQFWNYHIAIMVRDSEEGFIVVDPLQSQIIGYHEWIANNHRYAVKYPMSRVRFYVSDPRKFMPTAGSYSLEAISHPALKEYFFKLGLEIKNRFDAF